MLRINLNDIVSFSVTEYCMRSKRQHSCMIEFSSGCQLRCDLKAQQILLIAEALSDERVKGYGCTCCLHIRPLPENIHDSAQNLVKGLFIDAMGV